jgi:hypothetical protein
MIERKDRHTSSLLIANALEKRPLNEMKFSTLQKFVVDRNSYSPFASEPADLNILSFIYRMTIVLNL